MTRLKIQIHRTHQTSTIGRWLVAFPSEHMDRVRAHLNYVFTTIFPMMLARNGQNNKDLYYFNGSAPDIAGRPTIDPEMNDCFQTINSDYSSNPQNGEEENNDQSNNEIHAHKKRRSEKTYAEMTNPTAAYANQPNQHNTTTNNNSNRTNGLTSREMQEIMSSQLEEQNKATKKLLAEQSERIDQKLFLLANEQDRKLLEMTERNKQEQINNNGFLSKELSEYVEKMVSQVAATLSANTNQLLKDFEKNTALEIRKAFEHADGHYSRPKNRMEIDTSTQSSPFQPTPAVTPGLAANDTRMSLSSDQR